MAVVLRAKTPGVTAAKYDELNQKLDAAGASSPAGRLYHVCFGDRKELLVSDVWESREAFEKFGEKLRPLMQDLGVARRSWSFSKCITLSKAERRPSRLAKNAPTRLLYLVRAGWDRAASGTGLTKIDNV